MIEFLHRVLAVFRDYFGSFDENSMKDNFSTVYQVRLACPLESLGRRCVLTAARLSGCGSCWKRCWTMGTR